jgi:uncharacterized membrane protein
MFKTEESRIAIVILGSFALLLITGVFPQYVLWGSIALIALIVGLAAYSWLAKKKPGDIPDERTALYSLKASRNGFAAAMLLLALLAAAVSLGAHFSIIDVAQMAWGLSMAAYFLSYLYYKNTA